MTPKSIAPRKPTGLSARSERLWIELHAEHDFSLDADELCERGLRAFDLSDKLYELARKAGLATPKAKGLLASARDAAMVGLKLFKGVGFDKIDTTTRRPGRPSDAAWSAQRRGSA
jgi:hypothetical protein